MNNNLSEIPNGSSYKTTNVFWHRENKEERNQGNFSEEVMLIQVGSVISLVSFR